MALIQSKDIPLNSVMPAFELEDPQGKKYQSDEIYGPKGLLVCFTCNHCPYAVAIWPRLVELAKQAKKLSIGTVAINPNINPDYPEDAPDKMLEKIKQWGIGFPYLVDAKQQVAAKFQAQCTPDLYLFNRERKLVYHGRLDDNWKDANQVTKHELKEAIDFLSQGKAVPVDQKPSMGCSIKWI